MDKLEHKSKRQHLKDNQILIFILILIVSLLAEYQILRPTNTNLSNQVITNNNTSPQEAGSKVAPSIPVIPTIVNVATTTTGGILFYGKITSISAGNVTISVAPLSTGSASLKASTTLDPKNSISYTSGNQKIVVPQSLFTSTIKLGDRANVYGEKNTITQIDIFGN